MALGLALGVCSAFAGDKESADSPARWIEGMASCMEKHGSFSAKVVQRVEHSSGKRLEPMLGTLLAAKGGRIRLAYTSPSPKTVVSDGKTIWAYDPEAKVVYESSVDGDPLASALYLVLGEREKELAQRFESRRLGSLDGLTVFDFVPRFTQPFARRILVTARMECPMVRRLVLVDKAGGTVSLTLDDYELGPGIKAGSFSIRAPKGIRTVRP